MIKNKHIPIAGRLKHFKSQWWKITSNQEIHSIISGWEIPFFKTPKQEHVPLQIKMEQHKKELLSKEVQSMLDKGSAITRVEPVQNQFVQ